MIHKNHRKAGQWAQEQKECIVQKTETIKKETDSGIAEFSKWDEECIGNKAVQMKKRINKLKDRNLELNHEGEERELRVKKNERTPQELH